jgi:hypothetical protein
MHPTRIIIPDLAKNATYFLTNSDRRFAQIDSSATHCSGQPNIAATLRLPTQSVSEGHWSLVIRN